MTRVAIVAGVRTPFAKAGRAYKDVHAADLLGVAYKGALDAAGIDPGLVDQVLTGCVVARGDQGVNVGRNGWIAAGLPEHVPATTLDTQCGSSQQATNLASAVIASGQGDIVVAGGIEAMSRTGLQAGTVAPDGEFVPFSPAQLARTDMGIHQGIAGERIAQKYGITREMSDACGVRSHALADQAWRDGDFKSEIVPVEVDGQALLSRDEGIRPSDLDTVAGLRPVYTEDGIITAASASQLSDGSSALVLASEEAVNRHDLTPLAWIQHTAIVGVDPTIMLEGPIAATRKLLERSGLTLDDVDLFEIHEAYATVVESWKTQFPDVPLDKLNIHGGAISIGHPFGASGGRQLAHLAHTLDRLDLKVGLQAMCCGGGIGTGTILVRD